MRIGFFCNEYPPRPHGGIGTFLEIYIDELVREGHEITLAQFGKFARTDWIDSVRVVTLAECTTPYISWLVNRVRLWRWLRAEALVGHIEIFEIPEYQGCLPFPFRACPVVVRLHLAESHIRSTMEGVRGKTYWLEKATLYWHRHWISVSHYILDETRRFFALNPLHSPVIYNPVPQIDASKLPILDARPSKYVIFVGAVSERKGALLLAEAMLTVFEAYPDVCLVYVGPETDYRGAPISIAIREILKLYADRVVLVGRVANQLALAWVKNASVLAFVSQIESFGLVATEAMSLGVPVICSAFGPSPEVVDDGVNGILINPHSREELEQALLKLLDNPLSAAVLGEAGQRKVMLKFSVSACIAKSLCYYQFLLNGRHDY